MKTLRNLTYALALTLATATGCKGIFREAPIIEHNAPYANGYDVQVWYGGRDTTEREMAEIRIGRLANNEFVFERGGLIYGIDIDGDRRPEKIKILQIPKGSPLENIACFKETERIFKEFEKRHK